MNDLVLGALKTVLVLSVQTFFFQILDFLIKDLDLKCKHKARQNIIFNPNKRNATYLSWLVCRTDLFPYSLDLIISLAS